ncbi:cytochrome P450 [Flammula alnicola]|nr:cytochrome P450 [Flammula alnicola]
MLILFVEALSLYVITWGLWRTFRGRFFKSALDNIPGPPAKSFWKGTSVFPQVFNNNAWEFHKEMTAKYGSVIKIKTLLGVQKRTICLRPKALHHIFVKDQYIFEETTEFIQYALWLTTKILSTPGDQHRKQRKMLNPVFSIAHMRDMVPTFYDITYKLRDAFSNKVKDGPQEIEVMKWMTRTALELIGQSGLGYSFDPLTEDAVPHPFSEAVKNLTHSVQNESRIGSFGSPLSRIGPPEFRRFFVDILPWKNLREVRDIVDVLYNTSVEIFESKKKALAEGDEALANQIGLGKDIMSILMRANMTTSKEEGLTRDELLGQMATLIFGAMDTTSSALTRLLYLLATHQDVQDKLRKEIKEAKEVEGGDLPYDKLVSLPYLDAICRETLRLYVLSFPARQDVVLPLSNPIKGLDGQEIQEIFIPKNTNIIIGIMASNRNPELWGPDVLEWKPERWLEPLPETVIRAHLPGIYSHLMTFIGGGRACIGFKFSQLEMKVVLLLLIESFRFSPTKDEIAWQMTGLTTPIVVGRKPEVPQLPLLVERVA